MKEKFDPTDEGRKRFLRKIHRAPLAQRAGEVWGDKGTRLLSELKAAYGVCEHGSAEMFDRYARGIMRGCARIEGDRKEKRRLAYGQACINKLLSEANPDGEELGSPLVALAKSAKITEGDALKIAVKLIEALNRRWPDDDDLVNSRVCDLLMNAASKSEPTKYLNVVLRNERSEKRLGRR